jgi:hypothetical protein
MCEAYDLHTIMLQAQECVSMLVAPERCTQSNDVCTDTSFVDDLPKREAELWWFLYFAKHAEEKPGACEHTQNTQKYVFEHFTLSLFFSKLVYHQALRFTLIACSSFIDTVICIRLTMINMNIKMMRGSVTRINASVKLLSSLPLSISDCIGVNMYSLNMVRNLSPLGRTDILN